MPRFFNRIRKQLAKENKFFQYSRYAIGEILLVVIGILIALQVDSWNEEEIQKKQSYQVLLNLKEELEESKSELENAINYLEQRVDKRLEFLNNRASNLSDSDKINRISDMIFFYTESIKLPIIESELGPEKKIIQWPELTKKMQNLSESVAYYNKGIEYLENDMYSSVLPYSVRQGLIIDLMVSNGMLKSQDYINADVYDSENFRNVIASSTLMTSALLEGAKRILNDYDELLLIIKEKVK